MFGPPTCRFSTNATNQVEAISRDVGVMPEFDKSRQQRVAESHMKVPGWKVGFYTACAPPQLIFIQR